MYPPMGVRMGVRMGDRMGDRMGVRMGDGGSSMRGLYMSMAPMRGLSLWRSHTLLYHSSKFIF